MTQTSTLRLAATLVILVVVGLGTGGLSKVRAEGGVAREQLELLGGYIARNVAYNSEYGVLIEDPKQLADLVNDVTQALPDVVGIAIRNPNGRLLAQTGAPVPRPPASFAAEAPVDAVTDGGVEVVLFQAIVAVRTVGADHERKGRVEVALRRHALDARSAFDVRGRFIAQNLAYNCEYSLLREDVDQLKDLVHGVLHASPEVVGVAVLNDKGVRLAERGVPVPDVASGREGVVWFRAQVETAPKDPRAVKPNPIGEVHVALSRTGSSR